MKFVIVWIFCNGLHFEYCG